MWAKETGSLSLLIPLELIRKAMNFYLCCKTALHGVVGFCNMGVVYFFNDVLCECFM